MKQKSVGSRSSSEKLVRTIKRKTRRQYSAEEKNRIPDRVHGQNCHCLNLPLHSPINTATLSQKAQCTGYLSLMT